MFDIKFKGLRIEPTLSASRELVQEEKDMYDVLKNFKEIFGTQKIFDFFVL